MATIVRIARLGLAAALAVTWQLTPPAVQPADAACTTASCATLEIVFSPGAGTGLVTTFPGGMDCEWTGSARTGTCVAQYDVGGGLDVTLFLDPGVHSYACYGLTCAGLETRLERTVRLNPGDNIDVFPVFNLGVRATVEMTLAGSGDGRVTSVPAALNCRWLDGVKSGTCRADFYFYPAQTYSVQIQRVPDEGNFACSGEPPFCGVPGQTYTSTLTVSPDYVSGPPANFHEAKPVAVTVSGSGKVVSNPAGIDCPTKCSVWLPPNYSDDPPRYTSLTATPADGWFIKDWSGACDGTTGGTCQFFNYTNGATAGVVFAQTSTPRPSATPRVTPRPTPTVRPATTPPPAASPSTGLPSIGPPASLEPGPSAEPGASVDTVPGAGPATADPAATPDAGTSPSAAAVASPDGPTPDASRPATPAVGAGQPGAGDLALAIVVGMVALVLLLVLGYLLGRRRAERAPELGTEP